MVQTNKEYQREYFEKENYTIFGICKEHHYFAKDSGNIHGV